MTATGESFTSKAQKCCWMGEGGREVCVGNRLWLPPSCCSMTEEEEEGGEEEEEGKAAAAVGRNIGH